MDVSMGGAHVTTGDDAPDDDDTLAIEEAEDGWDAAGNMPAAARTAELAALAADAKTPIEKLLPHRYPLPLPALYVSAEEAEKGGPRKNNNPHAVGATRAARKSAPVAMHRAPNAPARTIVVAENNDDLVHCAESSIASAAANASVAALLTTSIQGSPHQDRHIRKYG